MSTDEDIPLIVKPISEMVNYECAICSNGDEFNYDLNRDYLKNS